MVGIYHSRWRAVAARGTRQFTADRRSGGLVVLPVEHGTTHVNSRMLWVRAAGETKETPFARAFVIKSR